MKLTQAMIEGHLKKSDDPQLNLLYQILFELQTLNGNLNKLDKLNKLDDIEDAVRNIKIVNQQVAQSSEQMINSSNSDEYEAEPFIPTIEAKEGEAKGVSATHTKTTKRDISKNVKGLKDLKSGDDNAN